MGIFSLIGVALTAAVLALTIKQASPVFALLTALAAGLCLMWAAIDAASGLVTAFHSLAAASGIASEIYLPVLKAVGIAAAVRIAGAICKDAGQSALAVKLEMVGAVAAIAVCLPLFEQVLNIVTGMLE